jgi:hypothetical protein
LNSPLTDNRLQRQISVEEIKTGWFFVKKISTRENIAFDAAFSRDPCKAPIFVPAEPFMAMFAILLAAIRLDSQRSAINEWIGLKPW